MKTSEDWLLIKRKIVSIKNESDKLTISPRLITMLIIAEDHRFEKHCGVDLVSILRATWRTIFCRRTEGASTIAMQLVRVLTGRYERTLKRKIQEMYLATKLTKHINKSDLPKLYLFVAYFGWRMNGITQLSNRLKIDLLKITDMEAAGIIARLKYPEPQKYDHIRIKKIQNRAKYILLQSVLYTTANSSKGDTNGTF
ncbi:biosynthetic peptidoglycan transglycosylase [Kluyvera sichuanensis]|uniref:biosynthetic peptidoglycan transglycosylase n=1 Tax=Kluyvera sichuanensis TaxID=2725494 RepID=UPI0034A21FC4